MSKIKSFAGFMLKLICVIVGSCLCAYWMHKPTIDFRRTDRVILDGQQAVIVGQELEILYVTMTYKCQIAHWHHGKLSYEYVTANLFELKRDR